MYFLKKITENVEKFIFVIGRGHSCYNVHLNEAGRDTKSEQFPRMGPVSIMNAVILLFGADGALFREKK